MPVAESRADAMLSCGGANGVCGGGGAKGKKFDGWYREVTAEKVPQKSCTRTYQV